MDNLSLPLVGGLPDCPKCGESGPYARKIRYCAVPTADTICAEILGDHIHVTCDKCAFIRLARCKDTVAPVAVVESGNSASAGAWPLTRGDLR